MTAIELKNFNNKTVVINFRDGEVATARLTCTGDNCTEVIVDILGTNCPDRYHEPNACSYTVPITEIIAISEISDASGDAAVEEPTIDFPAAA